MRFHYWDSLIDLKTFFENNDVTLVGIEIMDESISVLDYDFSSKKKISFMLGNEGLGLNDKQKKLCDEFIYIPQFSNATASLNVAMAATIIFHQWASKFHKFKYFSSK